MTTKVAKETPLAQLILRKYERPKELEQRDVTKKLCLSIGLLQPGDSRDVVVDILSVMLQTTEPLASTTVTKKAIDHRKQHNLPLKGIADSNVRRQLKRLKDLFLIESVQNKYRITENERLVTIFDEKIEKFYLASIRDRVREYFEEASKLQQKS
tara:strand:+ start:491 stop:955 length:465 start_codon:yes stop_codon:yes gene_type:complete